MKVEYINNIPIGYFRLVAETPCDRDLLGLFIRYGIENPKEKPIGSGGTLQVGKGFLNYNIRYQGGANDDNRAGN